jgi:hypothetical protein
MTGEIEILRPRDSLPSIFEVQPHAKKRMRDFFSSHIRNKNTRRAYLEAVGVWQRFGTRWAVWFRTRSQGQQINAMRPSRPLASRRKNRAHEGTWPKPCTDQTSLLHS